MGGGTDRDVSFVLAAVRACALGMIADHLTA